MSPPTIGDRSLDTLRSVPLTPEAKALLQCARPTAPTTLVERLAAICAGPFDWDVFLQLAVDNRVAPLVARNLRGAPKGLVPEEVAAELESVSTHHERLNEPRWRELVAILEDFKAEGIPAIPFKGPILVKLHYRDIGARPFRDLDILVRPEDWPRVKRVLLKRGYAGDPAILGLSGEPEQAFLHTSSCHLFIRNDPDAKHVIDLQWKLASHDWIDPELFWQHCETVEIDGTELQVVQNEACIAYLGFHGTKHLWGQLRWIADLAAILETVTDIDEEKLFRIAREGLVDGERKVSIALDLASSLVGETRRRELLAMSRRDRATRGAAVQVSGWLFGRGDERVSGSTRGFPRHKRARYFWSFPKGPLAKANFYRLCLWNFIRPTHLDVGALRLPRALQSLYIPIRFLRIAGQQVAKRFAAGQPKP